MLHLYSAEEIHSALHLIFDDPSRRRIAVVAFVGRHAAALLPHPRGVELYCWPEPGATSAEGIRRLLAAGTIVKFVDRVHAKVFWCEGRGAIVGSANLSTNGMTSQGLREAGVLVEDGEGFDINQLLKGLSPRAVTEKELNELERSSSLLRAQRRRVLSTPESPLGVAKAEALPPITFRTWAESPFPTVWRFAPWFGEFDDEEEQETAEVVEDDFQREGYNDAVQVEKNHFQVGEWVLAFRWRESGGRVRAVAGSFRWLFADKILRGFFENGDDQVIQLDDVALYGTPPFVLDDAFEKAMLAVDWDPLIRKTCLPSQALIRALLKQLR